MRWHGQCMVGRYANPHHLSGSLGSSRGRRQTGCRMRLYRMRLPDGRVTQPISSLAGCYRLAEMVHDLHPDTWIQVSDGETWADFRRLYPKGTSAYARRAAATRVPTPPQLT